MKASANEHLEVVQALAGEYGADVDINIKSSVSCVHQPELILLLGWCMCGVYSQLV